MQDYLKAVYRLRELGGRVTTQRLSEELGVTAPSVTNMVKRLHDANLLDHSPYHGVELTDSGERVALDVIRHHRLLETYLVESLGVPWDAVHDEADRLEHYLSDDLEARIDAALGYPTRDPHGDPIPNADGVVDRRPSMQLLDLAPGERATVLRVTERDAARLRYLGGLGIVPGAVVTLLDRLPFDGPIRIVVAGIECSLGPAIAAAVHIDRLPSP